VVRTARGPEVHARRGVRRHAAGRRRAAAHLEVLDALASKGIRCEPSIKLTQLGLDLGKEQTYANLRALAERSHATGNYLWIDMEQSAYVDVTLELTARIKAEFPRTGVCLQAYLRRTGADLKALIDQGIGVRLVKGAYKEPPELAFPKKADVDENFFALSVAMLEGLGRKNGFRPVFGTHDAGLIARIRAHAERAGLAARDVEVHMLYGIQRAEQGRLVEEGSIVRVLIAYGTYWFPWYMRRLAERPANVWFVVRSMFAG
jgi:proline dehydrogenase